MLASLSARGKRRLRVEAEVREEPRDEGPVGDRQAFAELRGVDAPGEFGAHLAVERERDARGEQAVLREGVRTPEGQARRG